VADGFLARAVAFAASQPDFDDAECALYEERSFATGDGAALDACLDWRAERGGLDAGAARALLARAFSTQKPSLFARVASRFGRALAEPSEMDMPKAALEMAVLAGDRESSVAIAIALGRLPRGVERARAAFESALAISLEERSRELAAVCERALLGEVALDPGGAKRSQNSL
jgi:hypothetical protein